MEQTLKLILLLLNENIMDVLIPFRRLRFSSDADIVRLTNARIIIIIIIMSVWNRLSVPCPNQIYRYSLGGASVLFQRLCLRQC